MKDDLPEVSFIIPTLNAQQYLGLCLKSIISQNYPREKIEILVMDGGSSDKTKEIAIRFGAKIINNPQKLAEPGVNLGLQKARGELYIILAADNELIGPNWLSLMVRPFFKERIVAAFPTQVSTSLDNWITKYINTFTDPFNHFVYGRAANSRTFIKAYKIIKKGNDYLVFNFKPQNHPILAMAQGFMIRKSFKRPKGMEYDDMLPIIKLIEDKKQMAYVFSAHLAHHTIKDLNHFLHKQRWAIDNALMNRSYGLSSRHRYLSLERKMAMYFWPFYGISFILPTLRSFWGLLIDKEWLWIYHPIISWLAALIFWQELIRIKILRKEVDIKGKP